MMKKLSDFLEKRKQNLIYAGLVNVFFIVAYDLLFYPRFHSDLDIIMLSAVNGILGVNSSYILYSNVIIGKILTVLTNILPNIPWYIVLHYALVFGSLFIITYITRKRNRGFAGKFISVIIVAFLGYECYVEPNYMKTAVVLCVSALYMFFYFMETKARKKLWLVIVVAVLSSMISLSVFWISFFIGGCIFLVDYFRRGCSKNAKIITCTTAASIMCLVLLLHIVDVTTYNLNDRQDSITYRVSIEKIHGYGISEYSEDWVEKYDLDATEYKAIANGLFIFQDCDQMELVKDITGENQKFSLDVLSDFFKEVPISLFKTGMLYYLGVLLVIYFVAGEKKNMIAESVALLLFVYAGFYFCNAWRYEWISFIVILPVSLHLLFNMKDVEIKEKEVAIGYIFVLSIILYSNFSSTMVSSVRDDVDELLYLVEEEYSDDIKVVYLVDYLRTNSVFEAYDEDFVLEDVYLADATYLIMGDFTDMARLRAPNEDEWYVSLYGTGVVPLEELFVNQ